MASNGRSGVMVESQAARRRAFQAYFADEGHCTTSQCDFFQVPRARASSFLGAIEAPAASSTVRVLTAAPPLRSSFTMYHGDFRSELCSDGEAMRIDPEGKPYLVDTQARHDVQLDFALMIALVIFVGTAVAGVTFGMNQAKNREASAGSEAFDAPVAAVAGAGAVASPAAKTKAKAKPKPKPKVPAIAKALEESVQQIVVLAPDRVSQDGAEVFDPFRRAVTQASRGREAPPGQLLNPLASKEMVIKFLPNLARSQSWPEKLVDEMTKTRELPTAEEAISLHITPKSSLWTMESSQRIIALEDGELERRLNATELTLLGIGACIGAGIFVLTGAEARIAGPSVAVSFLLAGLSSIFNGLCFAELATRLPVSGSSYLYVYCMFGELPALMMVVNQLVDYHIGAATLMLFLVTWVVSRGAETNAVVTSVVTVVKICVVILVIVIGWQKMQMSYLHPFFPYGLGATIQSAATLSYAFIGYDVSLSDCYLWDLPRAMISALLTCAFLYVCVCLVLCGMQVYSSIDTSAPVASTFTAAGLNWVVTVVDVGSFAGMVTGLLAGIYGQSRIYFAMSRDGMAPSWLQEARSCAGWCGSLAAVLAAFFDVKSLASFLNIGVLLSYAMTAASVLLINTCHKKRERPMMLVAAAFSGLLSMGELASVVGGVGLLGLFIGAQVFCGYKCGPPSTFKCPWIPLTPLVALCSNVYLMFHLSGHAWLRLLVVSFLVFFLHSSAVCATGQSNSWRPHALGCVRLAGEAQTSL
eukprot:g16117.t1